MYAQSHTPTVVQGGDGTSAHSFWYVAVFQNDFAFSGKPLIFSTRWGIILRVVALLEARNVNKHGHHLGGHLGFNQEWARFQVKTARIEFLCPICKITQISTLHNFIHKLQFCWKKLKKKWLDDNSPSWLTHSTIMSALVCIFLMTNENCNVSHAKNNNRKLVSPRFKWTDSITSRHTKL